jgi:glucose-1-phosphate thymidylyltransferase
VLASGLVSDFVGSEAVLVHHGDILLRERLSASELDLAEQDLDALILRPHARLGPAGTSAGYIIGPEVQALLRREAAVLDDGLQRLRAAGARIGVREVDASMPCRGGTDALLATNRRMLEATRADQRGERVFGSELQGRVSLDPSAEVHDSLIRGPVAIGPRARITNAYIGPYTSIGADVQIDCAEVEHSIVLDRAQLRFVGNRIEGSLIGPDACITREFRMPQAIRLSVGAGAEVAIS